jgi:uncharacterized protein YndB with AHSA1/START domain
MLLEQLGRSLGDAPSEVDWRTLRDDYAECFGPEATRDGRRTTQGDRQLLTFDRILRHPPEKVWEALTTPEGMGRWWQAELDIEPHVDGCLKMYFRQFDHRMVGVITDFDPPRRFGFTWTESAAGKDSYVLFELTPDPLGTHLRLIHAMQAGIEPIGFAAGWHWHLDGLDDAVKGIATAWDQKRFDVLKMVYGMTL